MRSLPTAPEAVRAEAAAGAQDPGRDVPAVFAGGKRVVFDDQAAALAGPSRAVIQLDDVARGAADNVEREHSSSVRPPPQDEREIDKERERQQADDHAQPDHEEEGRARQAGESPKKARRHFGSTSLGRPPRGAGDLFDSGPVLAALPE
jgi:hypothetical protein